MTSAMIGRRSGVPSSGMQLLARPWGNVVVAPARAFSCLHVLVGKNGFLLRLEKMFRTMAVQCRVLRQIVHNEVHSGGKVTRV